LETFQIDTSEKKVDDSTVHYANLIKLLKDAAGDNMQGIYDNCKFTSMDKAYMLEKLAKVAKDGTAHIKQICVFIAVNGGLMTETRLNKYKGSVALKTAKSIVGITEGKPDAQTLNMSRFSALLSNYIIGLIVSINPPPAANVNFPGINDPVFTSQFNAYMYDENSDTTGQVFWAIAEWTCMHHSILNRKNPERKAAWGVMKLKMAATDMPIANKKAWTTRIMGQLINYTPGTVYGEMFKKYATNDNQLTGPTVRTAAGASAPSSAAGAKTK
jgi:hypothetical protein